MAEVFSSFDFLVFFFVFFFASFVITLISALIEARKHSNGQTIKSITGGLKKKNKNKSSGLRGNFNTVRKTPSFHILLNIKNMGTNMF